MKNKFTGMPVLFVILLLRCVSTVPDREEPYFPADFKRLKQSYPEARAVYLLNKAEVDYYHHKKTDHTIIRRHVILYILNERGYNYANVIIPYDNQTRIRKIRARTLLENGSIIPLENSQIYESNLFPEYLFYSDIHVKRFTMLAVEPGCMIEYEWEQKRTGLNLMNRWEFQKEDPVLCSRYIVHSPLAMPVNAEVYATDVSPVEEKSVFAGRKTIQWEMKNIPALKPEISMSNGYLEIPSLAFSPPEFDTWQDVSRWYWELYESQMQSSKGIRDFVSSMNLTRDVANEEANLKKIFNFVQKNIRYVAIEVGMGGYQPFRADDIFQKRYGDCKDMTLMMSALGREVGLEIYPVLISNFIHGPVDTNLVTHAHFNHVIAYSRLSDGREFWMDATDKNVPFGKLPWYDQGRNVLVVTLNQGALRETPVSQDNLSERKWEIGISPNGIASGQVNISLTGALANEMRTEIKLSNPANLKTLMGQNLLSAFPLTKISDLEIENLDNPEGAFKIQFQFSTDAIDIQNEKYFILQPGLFSGFNLHKLFYAPNRQYNVVLKYPLRIRDNMKINYPESWIAITGVSSDSLQTDYGIYKNKMSVQEPGTAFYQRDFMLSCTKIPAYEYPQFQNFLFQTFQLDRNLVLYQEYKN